MQVLALLALSSLASGANADGTCALAAQVREDIRPDLCAMPADVQALVERQETCEHFAGEEPYDDARRRELASAIARYCTGNEKRASALLERHRRDARITRWLRDYLREAGLEPMP